MAMWEVPAEQQREAEEHARALDVLPDQLHR